MPWDWPRGRKNETRAKGQAVLKVRLLLGLKLKAASRAKGQAVLKAASRAKGQAVQASGDAIPLRVFGPTLCGCWTSWTPCASPPLRSCDAARSACHHHVAPKTKAKRYDYVCSGNTHRTVHLADTHY